MLRNKIANRFSPILAKVESTFRLLTDALAKNGGNSTLSLSCFAGAVNEVMKSKKKHVNSSLGFVKIVFFTCVLN